MNVLELNFLQCGVFRYEEEKNVWVASHSDYPNFKAYAKTKGTSLALGIQTWHIFNDSKGELKCFNFIIYFNIIISLHFQLCFEDNSYTATLSFSFCTDEEFTCHDGNCVMMTERCDGLNQCLDKSDEKNCHLVVPNVGYNKLLTPPPLKGDKTLEVTASYNIFNVLLINEEENYIRFMYNLKKSWYNSFLTYQNLKFDQDNLISPDDKEMMWKPWFENINMEDRDKCRQAEQSEIIKVIPNLDFNSTRNSLTEFTNALLFHGSENIIHQDWTWTCEYICKFNYFWYPFDTQNCPMIINITGKMVSIKGKEIKYTGPTDLGKYYFKHIEYCHVDIHGRSGLFIDFTIERPILNKLITVFLPTAMLILISQVSTSFSRTFMDLVIEVNTTLLLVLTTL